MTTGRGLAGLEEGGSWGLKTQGCGKYLGKGLTPLENLGASSPAGRAAEALVAQRSQGLLALSPALPFPRWETLSKSSLRLSPVTWKGGGAPASLRGLLVGLERGDMRSSPWAGVGGPLTSRGLC